MGTTDLPLVAQLRQAIRESGLSLNEIGRRTGVSQGQLSRFLRGDRTLTLPAAARVCVYFGLELCRPRKPAGEESAGERRSSPLSPGALA
jgi:transcriptional regulator with XRE-family HTH domain